jgi:hypothetical protein
MKKSIRICVVLLAGLITTPLVADSFNNGGFESGTHSGWTQGGGYWVGEWPMNPHDYLPGGSRNNNSYMVNTIVGVGADPITGLPTVFSGNYAAKVNDANNNNSVSVISQTVSNYSDAAIYFAWAAVLQGSHGITDSDNFTLQLTDDTLGLSLYNVSYSSASASGTALFTETASGWFYTDWQVQNLDVSAHQGDTFTLTLLGSDCPYGGHAGYVYLDGFGAAPPAPGPDPGTAPEPSSLVLLGSGALLLASKVKAKLCHA